MRPDYTVPEGIIAGAGAAQDGDSPLWQTGRVIWAPVDGLDDPGFIGLSDLVNPCPVDFILRNNYVDTAELGVLLDAWLQTPDCLGAPYGDACLADVNCDGHVDTADLGLVLIYFLDLPACPVETACSGEAMLLASGAEMRELLMSAMGWERVEDYVAWVGSLDRTSREANFAVLLEAARVLERTSDR
jgi:hypothetical protein